MCDAVRIGEMAISSSVMASPCHLPRWGRLGGIRCRCGKPFVWRSSFFVPRPTNKIHTHHVRHYDRTNQSRPKAVGSEAVRRICTSESRLFHRPRQDRKSPFQEIFFWYFSFLKEKYENPLLTNSPRSYFSMNLLQGRAAMKQQAVPTRAMTRQVPMEKRQSKRLAIRAIP